VQEYTTAHIFVEGITQEKKNCLYKRSYTNSCMFITIKHKIIHQSLTDGDKTVREETYVLCEI